MTDTIETLILTLGSLTGALACHKCALLFNQSATLLEKARIRYDVSRSEAFWMRTRSLGWNVLYFTSIGMLILFVLLALILSARFALSVFALFA